MQEQAQVNTRPPQGPTKSTLPILLLLCLKQVSKYHGQPQCYSDETAHFSQVIGSIPLRDALAPSYCVWSAGIGNSTCFATGVIRACSLLFAPVSVDT